MWHADKEQKSIGWCQDQHALTHTDTHTHTHTHTGRPQWAECLLCHIIFMDSDWPTLCEFVSVSKYLVYCVCGCVYNFLRLVCQTACMVRELAYVTPGQLSEQGCNAENTAGPQYASFWKHNHVQSQVWVLIIGWCGQRAKTSCVFLFRADVRHSKSDYT